MSRRRNGTNRSGVVTGANRYWGDYRPLKRIKQYEQRKAETPAAGTAGESKVTNKNLTSLL